MLTMFALPNSFVSDITSNATDAISALSPYATLIIGVLLAVVVLSIIIRVVSNHK